LIVYDINFFDHKSIKEKIIKYLKSNKLIKIQVDYSQGVDLKRVAQLHNLTIQQVIKRHTDVTYRVYAIGFLEGFAYLAKVDSKIATPRLKTPRDKIKKGSVAIADNQTAIYPEDSAGGWNIIGVTEFDDFDKFEIGDRVRFISV
jgi:KipI family sensor histidine kinase inhibitor